MVTVKLSRSIIFSDSHLRKMLTAFIVVMFSSYLVDQSDAAYSRDGYGKVLVSANVKVKKLTINV